MMSVTGLKLPPAPGRRRPDHAHDLARAERHLHHVALLEGEALGHGVAIGRVQRQRDEDIGDVACHSARINLSMLSCLPLHKAGTCQAAIHQSALDLALPGAPDTRREAMQWLTSLAKERRLSPNTVEAYGRDLRQFLSLPDRTISANPRRSPAILALKPLDIRAFLSARRTGGRAEPLADASARLVAFLCPPSGARGPRHRVGLRGDSHPQDGEKPAAPALGRRPPSPSRRPISAREATGSPGSWRATPPCCRFSTARACASPKRSACNGETRRSTAPIR